MFDWRTELMNLTLPASSSSTTSNWVAECHPYPFGVRQAVGRAIGNENSEGSFPSVLVDLITNYTPTSDRVAEWIADPSHVRYAVGATIGKERTGGCLPASLVNLIADFTKLDCLDEEAWKNLCGRVSPAPTISKSMESFWQGPAVAFPGKRVRETHTLFYLPKTIGADEKPLNLKTFRELTDEHFKDVGILKARSITIFDAFAQRSLENSCWMVLTNQILEKSRNLNFEQQERKVKILAEVAHVPYVVPCALEASICMFMHFLKFREHFLSRDHGEMTHTRCQDIIAGYFVEGGHSAVMPSDNAINFMPLVDKTSSQTVGMAPMCKLSEEETSTVVISRVS